MEVDDKRKKKDRRRSSFTPRRISLLPPVPFSSLSDPQEIYKLLEKDLSPDERFSKLSQFCLQYTADQLKEEFTGDELLERICNDLVEKGNCIIGHLQGHRKDDGTPKQLSPHPIKDKFDVLIKETNQRINCMDDESEKWDTLSNDFRDRRLEAEMQAEVCEVQTEDLCNNVKSRAERDYLSERPDYQAMLSTITDCHHRARLQMAVYCRHARLIDKANKKADSLQEQFTRDLYRSTEVSTESAMESINRLISLPSLKMPNCD